MGTRYYIPYVPKDFSAAHDAVITQADQIIRDYDYQGYVLTLRQLYYQFVARGLIENTERSYKRLGSIVTDARLAGRLPWDGIEDRTRGIRGWLIEEDEDEVLRGIDTSFALDFWKPQNIHLEVWVEKEALGNVIQRACEPWRVPYMPCKGYLSASEAWRSGVRYQAAKHEGRDLYLIHLGDHDPSGIDMTRDNEERIELFASTNRVNVIRLALNRDQVDQYTPPPNPTKLSDSRANDYIEAHGYESWELDALEPQVINEMIDAEIRKVVDMDLWDQTQEEENEKRDLFVRLQERWEDVKTFLNDA